MLTLSRTNVKIVSECIIRTKHIAHVKQVRKQVRKLLLCTFCT